MSNLVNITAVIVDDEKNGRENLQNLIKKHCPNVQVISEADSMLNGIETIEKLKPQLIFLDIEMPGGNGFELLKRLNDPKPEVIFVTAYDQYAIRAFKFSAVDYLLKPIKITELKDAVEKSMRNHKLKHGERIGTLLDNIKSGDKLSKVALPVATGHEFVELKDIIRCQSENNYTWFFCANNIKIIVARTLKEYEDLFSESGFYRVHQSHLINILHIKKYQKGEHSSFLMSDGTSIQIAHRKKELVKEILDKLS